MTELIKEHEEIVFRTLPRKCPILTHKDLVKFCKESQELTIQVAVDRKTANKLGLTCKERLHLECQLTLRICYVANDAFSDGTYDVRVQVNSDTLLPCSTEEKGKDAPRRLGTYRGEFMPGPDGHICVGALFSIEEKDIYQHAVNA